MPSKVLICDEAESFRLQLKTLFRDAGVDVVTCATWPEVAAAAARERPDAIVADMLTASFGVDELIAVRNAAPEALLAVVSALHHDEDDHSVGMGGIDLVLSRRDPPLAIAAAVLERLVP
jgi:DNA-binding NarL/FixJ family response regulator